MDKKVRRKHIPRDVVVRDYGVLERWEGFKTFADLEQVVKQDAKKIHSERKKRKRRVQKIIAYDSGHHVTDTQGQGNTVQQLGTISSHDVDRILGEVPGRGGRETPLKKRKMKKKDDGA